MTRAPPANQAVHDRLVRDFDATRDQHAGVADGMQARWRHTPIPGRAHAQPHLVSSSSLRIVMLAMASLLCMR